MNAIKFVWPETARTRIIDSPKSLGSREVFYEIRDIVQDLDDYEATIALAYIKRLIK